MVRSRGLLTGIAIVMAVTVVGLAVVLRDSNSHSRQQLIRVFDQREGIGASLFDALLNGVVTSGGPSPGLEADQVTAASLEAAVAIQPTESVAVYTAGGQLLGQATAARGVAPVPPGVVRALIHGALMAGPSISNVLGSGALALGTKFRTPYGIRVELTEFPLQTINMLLPGYMTRMNDKGGESFILDGNDRVISTSVHGVQPAALAPDPELREAIAGQTTGAFTDDGASWHFTSGSLTGTDWKLVLAVPNAILFAPVSGPRQVVPWVLISLFMLSCLVVLALVRRARRDAERLGAANAKLELRNAEVEEANDAKSRFLAGMSHELRTPLNGIIGFAELMHDGKVGPLSDQHHEFMGDILASGRHLLRLINDVLDRSKVEAGRLEFDRQQVELTPLVSDILATLRPLATDNAITVTSEIAPEFGVVCLDPARFRQILLNYVSNAVKFTEPGGSVWVRLSPGEDGDLRLEVEDTGVGIAPGEIATLFTEFGQLGPGRGTATPGTGLGLALTKLLVEAQGGAVWVRSEPGVGSVFGAKLPCAPEVALEQILQTDGTTSGRPALPVEPELVPASEP